RMERELCAALRHASEGREGWGGVTGILVEQRRDENGPRATHEKRVAVWLRRRDRFCADDPAGSAGSVLHDHRLPERGGHLVGDEPRDLVRGATRRRRHDKFDGPIRIGSPTLTDERGTPDPDGEEKGRKPDSQTRHDPPPTDRSERV